MSWRRPGERAEIVHIVVTGYQKRKYPRKHYVRVHAAMRASHVGKSAHWLFVRKAESAQPCM